MKVQGRDCTLTVAKDDEYYPLPYSEETVRLTSKAFSLPGVIGCRNKDKFIETDKILAGCFTTKLMYSNILFLFLRLFNFNESFDIFANRICEKIIYRNAYLKEFNLTGCNDFGFELTMHVRSEEDFYTECWHANTPNFKAKDGFDESNDYKPYIYICDGHNLILDGKKLPLVTQFTIEGKYTEKVNYEILLCFPVDTEVNPDNRKFEKLTIPISRRDGIWLDVYDLNPLFGQVHMEDPGAIRGVWKFNVQGPIVLNIKNKKEYYEVLI